MTTSNPMTWTRFFALFSKSGLKLEKVLVLNSSGDLLWLAPKIAYGIGVVGRVRAVQVGTRRGAISPIIWHVRLSRCGGLLDTRELDESSWSRFRLQLLTISSSQESIAGLH